MFISEHYVAKVKAKYGISNAQIAKYLDINALEAKDKIEKDNFSEVEEKKVCVLETIIEHMIREAEMLQDQAPYLQVIEHNNEKLELQLKQVHQQNAELANNLREYKQMNFWKRVKFLVLGPNKWR